VAARSRKASLEIEAPAGFTKTAAGLWKPEQIQTAGANLVRAYESAPKLAHRYGKKFYPEWHETAEHIGAAAGLSTAHGAAILAHLSPQNEAEMNRVQAMGVVHGPIEGSRRTNAIIRAGQHADMAKSHNSSLREAEKRGDTKAMLHHAEQYDIHHSENMRLRQASGIVGTPLNWISSQRLSQAVRVREGHFDDPLGSLGAVKISDFGRMTHDPRGYQRPPIDTHYHDAAMGRTDIPYDQKGADRGLDAPTRYENFQRAHQVAHAIAGGGTPHSSFMGTIWYAHQMRKAIENPESSKTRKAADTRLRNVQGNPRFSQWLPESHGLAPAFAKVGV
jgi:hypothetical protein